MHATVPADRRSLCVGLVGDHNPAVTAHRAIPEALRLAAEALGVAIEGRWMGTETIVADSALEDVDAIWCVPASPYKSTDGALRAIRFAREQGLPFLGTCGGFQHAVLEYARTVLRWSDADHAETALGGGRLVIAPLACALVEARDEVRFVPGSRLAAAYGRLSAVEGYRCRYGMSAEFVESLTSGPLRVTATDTTGEVRAVELDDHPFYVATLFQPERAALGGVTPPIVLALVRAAAARPGQGVQSQKG